jgi:kynurenine formamidase
MMCVPGCQEALQHALSRRKFFAGAAAAGFAAAAVAPATAAPRPARPFRTVIDLTHTMSAEFPTFDGSPGLAMERVTEFKANGYNMYRWHLIEHAGTHLDAPIHFSETGITADRISADTLVTPLAVVDVSAKAARDPNYALSRDDVAAWERRHGRLPDNCCVAMHSGWAQRVSDPAKFTGKDAAGVLHFPGFAPEAADFLLKQRKVVGLAVDTLSLDPGPSKDFRTHLLWLPSGRWGLENVANLDKVPPSGATLVVGLAKIKDATGGASRLLALV